VGKFVGILSLDSRVSFRTAFFGGGWLLVSDEFVADIQCVGDLALLRLVEFNGALPIFIVKDLVGASSVGLTIQMLLSIGSSFVCTASKHTEVIGLC
jgi:hypothetical protein